MKDKEKKPKIEINPKNEGKFTDYCKKKGYNGVTEGCIQEGMDSTNPTTKKRANFANNFGKKKKS